MRCSSSGRRRHATDLARTGPRPDSEAVEEERRLLYVGITRARVHLAFSWALARTAGGRQNRRPSRFLNGIAHPGNGSDPVPQAASTARSCAALPGLQRDACRSAAIMLRRCEKCPAEIDEELLRQLKEWRLRTAERTRRARVRRVHRQHADRDRRAAARRRCRIGGDSGHRCAQARAVRARRAGPRPRPQSTKPQVKKWVVGPH